MGNRAAVAWTGGKDSALALYRSLEAGLDVECLVTFCPEDAGRSFKAHPIHLVQKAARLMELSHRCIALSEPYRTAYISALDEIRHEFGLDAVVTGDIAPVNGLPNWMKQCCDAVGLELLTPLWGHPRDVLLHEIVDRGIIARVSWINSPHIPPAWLNRRIDSRFIEDIQRLAREVPIDICGENGEYHTMVERIVG